MASADSPVARVAMDGPNSRTNSSKRTLSLLYDHMDNPVSSEAFTIIHREITSGQRKVLVFENRQNPFGDPIPFSIYGA